MKAKNLFRLSLLVAVLCALLAITTLAADPAYPAKVITFDGTNTAGFGLPVVYSTSRSNASFFVNDNGNFVNRFEITGYGDDTDFAYGVSTGFSLNDYPYMKIKSSTTFTVPVVIYLNGWSINSVLYNWTTGDKVTTFNFFNGDGYTACDASFNQSDATSLNFSTIDFRVLGNASSDQSKSIGTLDFEYIAFFHTYDEMMAYNGPEAKIGENEKFNEDNFSIATYANSFVGGATVSDVVIADGKLSGKINNFNVTVPYEVKYPTKVIAFDGNEDNVQINLPVLYNFANTDASIYVKEGKFINRFTNDVDVATDFALGVTESIKLNDYPYIKVKSNTDMTAAIQFYVNGTNYVTTLRNWDQQGEKVQTFNFFSGEGYTPCSASFSGNGGSFEGDIYFTSAQFHVLDNYNISNGFLDIEYIAFFHSYDQMMAYEGPEANTDPFNEATFSLEKYTKGSFTNGKDAAISTMTIGDGVATGRIGASNYDIAVTIPFEANDYGMTVENLGAQIRVDDVDDEAISEKALRFGTKLNYDTANTALEDVVYGAIVGTPGSTPKKEYGANNAPLNFHNAKNFETKEDGIYFNTVVTGIPADQITTQVKVTPFITYTVNGGNYTRYFAPIIRSVQNVLDALADNAETEWDVEEI
ncbi:MAG: hypothetical protein E7588_03535 [Ruminococcaceae bacterium]|nr:hypothetical protein [Oscillospiraceae bacterium]